MAELNKTKVRKELRTDRPSIYSFELDEIKQWLTDNGKARSVRLRFLNGYMKNAYLLLKK